METNEIMTGVEVVEEVVKPAEEIAKKTGIGSGTAMLIGSGLTLAVIAGGAVLRFAYTKLKAKKEMKTTKSEKDGYIDAATFNEEEDE